MKKGITPVIAIIILLFITIALAGAAWTFLQGFMLGYTGKAFQVPNEGIYCDAGHSIKALVINTGTQRLISSDFVICEIDGTDITPVAGLDLAPPNPPEPGDSEKVINDNNGGPGWPSGKHTVRVGTGTSVVVRTVYCP